MKDIPVFTTEYGVASLALSQLPERKEAYIHIRDVQPENLEALLSECADFCRMCGAERIYATGAELASYPEQCVIYEMQGRPECDGKEAMLFPVTEQNVSRWRQLYNEKMQTVDHAAVLRFFDEKRLIAAEAYFIHQDRDLLGIGWREGEKLLAMASMKPGAGETVLKTLYQLQKGKTMVMEVASTNEKAIQLYERLGFVKTKQLRKWHQIR